MFTCKHRVSPLISKTTPQATPSARYSIQSTCPLLVPIVVLQKPDLSRFHSKTALLPYPDPSSKPSQVLPTPCRPSVRVGRSSRKEMRFVSACLRYGRSTLTHPALGNQEEDRDRLEQEEAQCSTSPTYTQGQSWNSSFSPTQPSATDQAQYHCCRSGSAHGCKARGLRLGHRRR